jgi:hypothetical protein
MRSSPLVYFNISNYRSIGTIFKKITNTLNETHLVLYCLTNNK